MITVQWRLREVPLAGEALLAQGDVVLRLVNRLLKLDDAALATLSGVGSASMLFIVGTPLVWVDGVRMLGKDPAAPGLWLPTTHQPTVPLGLFAEAVTRRTPAPVAVFDQVLLPVGGARPIDRATLRAVTS